MPSNIIVEHATACWEFIHTRDLRGSSLRLRSHATAYGHWSLTAEARRSATASGGILVSSEDPNTLEREMVPSEVITQALRLAGAGAHYVAWP